MPIKKVLVDDDNNVLQAYINQHDKCYIHIGKNDGEIDIDYSGYICLEKEDVQELINILNEIKEQM